MTRWPAVAVCVAVAVSAVAAVGAGAASRPAPSSPAADLRTAVVDAATFKSADSAAAFANARRAGATVVRLVLDWSVVAPAGAAPPEGFVPTRPDDASLRLGELRPPGREAVSLGLAPIADIIGAPAWAQRPPAHRRTQDGPYWPKYTALGAFARAAALRYSGVFGDLPRVRYWQVWNEPNLSVFLTPQLDGTDVVSAGVVPRHGQRRCRGVARGAPRQPRHRRRLSPRSGASFADPTRIAIRSESRRSGSCANALHVEGRTAEADLRPDVAVRRVVAPSVHERRADAQRRVRTTCRSATSTRCDGSCAAARQAGRIQSRRDVRLLGDGVQLGHVAARPEGLPMRSTPGGSPRRCTGCGGTASRS